jgi:hypothetical protein
MAVAIVALLGAASDARAERKAVLRAADASRPVDAAEARAAVLARYKRGPLPGMHTSAKKAANRARDAQFAKGKVVAPVTAESGGSSGFGVSVVQFGGHNDPGQDADAANASTPPHATGAIGATRFVQLVNTRFGIYNRATDALIAEGPLSTLFEQPVDASSFNPQILWDNQTRRFYYLGSTIRGETEKVLSFGWSTTASPANGHSHWCHYEAYFNNPSFFPDYPRLGDSQFFIIFGTNDFFGDLIEEDYEGSTLWAVSKPPAGTACPSADSVPFGMRIDIRDAANDRVFTPVPANDIDTKPLGYWIAMDDDVAFSGITSNRLYIGSVGRNPSTGAPIFNNPKNLTVPTYTLPAAATQFGNTRDIDTLDGRNTQANMARNPDRANQYSLWTQHTIRGASAASSFVRWYEINPFPNPPTVLRSGNIGENIPNTFFYNGAISPDRRADGAIRQFGDSFVINYNASRSGAGGLNPFIFAGSSFDGGPIGGFVTVRTSRGANLDFSCPGVDDTCGWGGAAAAPDPKPPTTPSDRGAVWGTSQTAGPGATTGNPSWGTFFFAHRP